MLTLHLRINDAATKRPTPVRVSITDPTGRFYAPLGRFPEFPIGRNEAVGGGIAFGRDLWFVIDGACEIALPSGVPLRLRAAKGPEFTPIDETITLGAGQMALRFEISRWSDVRKDGWFPGDARCHFLTPHDAALEGAAEDLAFVNLLVTVQDVPGQNGKLYPVVANLAAFSGQATACEQGGTQVAVNTLNVHPHLGKVGLLHSHRIIHPLTFGGADATDDWSLCDWCEQCHRKKGLTTWVEPNFTTSGEAEIALILGKIDAVELEAKTHPGTVKQCYAFWNAGFLVPFLGASGKSDNTMSLGAMRTYAKLNDGEPPTYTNWMEAVRAGRTFVTNGPLLDFHWNAAEQQVQLSAACANPFDTLQLLFNQRVVAEAAPAPGEGRFSATIQEVLPLAESGWLAARAIGGESRLCPGQRHFAHTAPIRVYLEGKPPPSVDVTPLRRRVEATRDWLVEQGRFLDDRRRLGLLAYCEAALARLNEPTP